MDLGTWQVVASVVAGLLMMVGALGTVFPVLPGSLTSLVALVVWGIVMNTTATWVAAGIGIVLLLAGMSFSYVLTGRSLRRQRIPKGPILYGVVGAVIGMFVIPVLGLFLGFAIGLFLGQLRHRGDVGSAARSSWEALKAMGIGMLVEFLCACLAGSAFIIGALVHYW